MSLPTTVLLWRDSYVIKAFAVSEAFDIRTDTGVQRRRNLAR